ncbi:nuclear transport factor 2 family protein [Hamadaea sp. NPDC050747]|uniref:nuclear transport factor 2 family protein n=1 Tax=Hamadaea sp. NPDC050747 TaxID=3155789 RepID=UPI0033E45D43
MSRLSEERADTMTTRRQASPAQFVHDFFTDLTEQVVFAEADTAGAMAKFYTPDIVQISDGIRLDWDKLLAHMRPARKTLTGGRFSVEVHEAIASGDTIATRFTLRVTSGKGRRIDTEVFMFASFTPDGRMRQARQLTRSLPDD